VADLSSGVEPRGSPIIGFVNCLKKNESILILCAARYLYSARYRRLRSMEPVPFQKLVVSRLVTKCI